MGFMMPFNTAGKMENRVKCQQSQIIAKPSWRLLGAAWAGRAIYSDGVGVMSTFVALRPTMPGDQ